MTSGVPRVRRFPKRPIARPSDHAQAWFLFGKRAIEAYEAITATATSLAESTIVFDFINSTVSRPPVSQGEPQ